MSTHVSAEIDRAALLERLKTTRERSRRLFDLLTPDAYYAQPIRLRHPIVFYEGHLAAFSFNTLVKRGLGQKGIDERLERLFARGIDPEDDQAGSQSQPERWPSRDEVRAFADEVDRRVLDAIASAAIEQRGHPLLDRGHAVHVILEHEAMHQETMHYMWHQLPYGQKQPVDEPAPTEGVSPPPEKIIVPAGRATLGAGRDEIPFGWDNEFEAQSVSVPAFRIDRHNVTNGAFLEFVEAGGYANERWWTPEAFAWIRAERIAHPGFWVRSNGSWFWRGMFRPIPLPEAWPAYVSHSEAAAFARWRGERLPTEAEIVRAAFGTPTGTERAYPWGEDAPDETRGRFDFRGWSPQPVGQFPSGRSAWGVDDLVGNGWEWTSTVFGPLPGFEPMPSYPEYSADFFDSQHYVLKGASHATDRHLLRRSFRNWFRPHYPYVYAAFRCASSLAT